VLTRAAVLRGTGRDWEVVDLELDAPRQGEALVRFVAAGLCHSDDHLRHLPPGRLPVRFPLVGGHEGAGVVVATGPGVDRVAPGDHVVCSSVPACGDCHWSRRGHHNLCDLGANLLNGSLPTAAGGFRFHRDGEDYGAMSFIGSFSEHSVVPECSLVRIDRDVPLQAAVLLGCSVATGWGAAVKVARVAPGDTVVVYGAGGIGVNAVQGARHAGARHILVVEPVGTKRDRALALGATHAVASAGAAQAAVAELTGGRLAEHAIVAVALLEPGVVGAAFDVVGKNGTITLVGVGDPSEDSVRVNGTMLVLRQKRILGTLFGGISPIDDMPRLVDLYRSGELLLEELVTSRYRLEDVARGYEDLAAGRNVRGIVVYD
jgi:S-(hydroxymethyl)glutathione dehydrogenase/alcohol dehydrogenase